MLGIQGQSQYCTSRHLARLREQGRATPTRPPQRLKRNYGRAGGDLIGRLNLKTAPLVLSGDTESSPL
jgi:hypothetical protein